MFGKLDLVMGTKRLLFERANLNHWKRNFKSRSQSYLTTDGESAILGFRHSFGARDNFSFSLKISLDSCGFAILWQRSVIYFCC
jgi:hypothetical protein